MPDLTSNPVSYAEFILRYLMQRVEPQGSEARAVAETEHAVDGDRWFWADDNAKVLEFLAIPSVWEHYPDHCVDVLRFIESLCDGPFILRRTGHPRLDEVSVEGGVGHWVHTFMNVSCDLQHGVVRVGMRFHDGRTAHNLALTGNYIHFTHDGIQHSLDVEDAISDWEIRRDGPTLLLRHASEMRFEAAGSLHRLGRLEYRYRIDARTMFVDVDVALDLDAAITVSDVVLTVGQDNLSHMENGVHYSEIGARVPGAGNLHFSAKEPGNTGIHCPGADYWSIYQRAEMSGFALGIHTLPANPATMESVQAVVRDSDVLHWIVAQHRLPGSHRGSRLAVAERKVITAGGFYDQLDDCADMLARRSTAPLVQPVDLSISYDYGAEINAFARLHRTVARDPGSPMARMLCERTRALFDRYYDVYARMLLDRHDSHPAAIFSRPLAFTICGLIDMALTTGAQRYLDELARAVRVLLTFERTFQGPDGRPESAFLMGQATCVAPFVDCHSAALLALLRSLPVLEDPALITSIDRALEAFRLETAAVELGDLRKMETVTVHWVRPDGHRLNPHAYWNFCAGLTLRLFKLLRQSPHQATREILQRHLRPIEAFEAILNLQVARALRERGPAIEVLTGLLSGEGNSETQPWVALGLVADSGDL